MTTTYDTMDEIKPKICGFYVDTALTISIWLHGLFTVGFVIICIYVAVEGSYPNLWNLAVILLNVFLILCLRAVLKWQEPRLLLPFIFSKPVELIIRMALLIYHGVISTQHMREWNSRIDFWTKNNNMDFVSEFKEARNEARDRLFAVSALVLLYLAVEVQQIVLHYMAFQYYKQKKQSRNNSTPVVLSITLLFFPLFSNNTNPEPVTTTSEK